MKLFMMLLLMPVLIFSQTNYYSGTDGLYGNQLKSDLHTIIRGHTRYPYSSSSTDVWDILTQADKDPNNPNNVILIYTGFSVNGPQEYNNGSGWNREHVWAKSHGFPDQSDTAYTDCHHLHAADISTNSARGNKDFDNGGNQYFDGGTVPTGCYSDFDSWEPRDAVKGDVARSMFYMATRYETNYDLELVDYTGTSSSSTVFGKESTLLEWNRIDPPDNFERRRNNVVYGFQHNRNPFIDHPEFADRIYSPDAFQIETVESIYNTKIVVKFSKDVDAVSAADVNNYQLTESNISISSVEISYQGDDSKVLLTTSNTLTDSMDIVRVSNITSDNGETIIPNSLSSFVVNHVTSVNDNKVVITDYKLNQNYPNPFNPSTIINYQIPEASFVSLKIYNILGNEVATLVNKNEQKGNYSVTFDAASVKGNFASGIYFYRLTAGNFSQARKMILAK